MEKLSLQRRDLIIKFYSDHKDAGKSFTCKHFQALRVPRTIYSVLARFEERGETSREKGSGRPAAKLTKLSRNI